MPATSGKLHSKCGVADGAGQGDVFDFSWFPVSGHAKNAGKHGVFAWSDTPLAPICLKPTVFPAIFKVRACLVIWWHGVLCREAEPSHRVRQPVTDARVSYRPARHGR